jgi:hypothetical protein
MKKIYRTDFQEYIIPVFLRELKKYVETSSHEKELDIDKLSVEMANEMSVEDMLGDFDNDAVNFYLRYTEPCSYLWCKLLEIYAYDNRKLYKKFFAENMPVDFIASPKPPIFTPFGKMPSENFMRLLYCDEFTELLNYIGSQTNTNIFKLNDEFVDTAGKLLAG